MTGPLDRVSASGRFRAVRFTFSVRTHDAALGRYIDRLFATFAEPGTAEHQYSLVDTGQDGEGRYELQLDGEVVSIARYPRTLLSHLLWHVNRMVVATAGELVMLHASAAEHNGVVAVFPAEMESGKSTLVAGLISRGLRYVTDESVAIEPGSLMVQPYPRAVSLDRGSWSVLPHLRPRTPADIAHYLGEQWQVEPLTLRRDIVAPPARIGLVILPSYQEGAPTGLVPIPRSEALRAMAANSFNLQQLGAPAFRTLGEVARRARCFRLTMGALDPACDLVLGALGAAVSPMGRVSA